MRVRRLAAIAVALPLLTLSGCGGDNPKPKPYDPPATSASPSPTAGTTPQAESPEAFIRRWVAADTKMQNTGDTTIFRTLGDHCHACDEFAKQVEGIYKAGGWIKTRGLLIRSITPASSSVYLVKTDSSPTTYVASKGGKETRPQGGRFDYRFTLVKRDGAWKVEDYAQVES